LKKKQNNSGLGSGHDGDAQGSSGGKAQELANQGVRRGKRRKKSVVDQEGENIDCTSSREELVGLQQVRPLIERRNCMPKATKWKKGCMLTLAPKSH